MTDRSFGDHTDRSVVKNPLLSTAVVGLSIEDLTHNAILLPVAQNPGLISSQDAETNHAPITQSGDAKPTPDPKTDDFDVKEYFARLQGTRYVSAPINSTRDQNASLPEENLEEINLNESTEEVQSLTSDIKQNFSQLPQVLPQVASAVFNSFSNMLNYPRRDGREGELVKEEYQEGVRAPQALGEPPVGSSNSNFRITTKKKAYAQIPGLSQASAQAPFNLPQQTQPSYFAPSLPQEEHIPQKSELPGVGLTGANTSIASNIWSPELAPIESNFPPPPQAFVSQSDSVPSFNPVASFPTLSSESSVNSSVTSTPSSLSISSSFSPSSAVIPPPTMFSNAPRSDGQIKTLLPPSVARRLSGNQPVIKSQTNITPFAASIFVPGAVVEESKSDEGSSERNAQLMFGGPAASVAPDFASGDVADRSMTAPTLFNPASIDPTPQIPSSTPANIGQTLPPMSASIAPPPFNPPTVGPSTLGPPKQMFDPAAIITNPPEPPKPAPEPPKIVTGNVNFRMAKKRPQYYSGPIEGVGSISNNIKPVIAPVESSAFQGALFTPQSVQEPEITPFAPPTQASVPFDLSRPAEDNSFSSPSQAPFDMSRPTNVNLGSDKYSLNQNQYGNLPQQQYSTSFDLSRQTTEAYEEAKQESKGFGIIGSLKSKLTSLDINKIQNSVTTFFDPAYNADKHGVGINQENQPYSNPSHNHSANETSQFSGLEIHVSSQAQQNFGAYDNENVYPNQYYQPMHQYGYQNPAQNVPVPSSSFQQTNPYLSPESQPTNQGNSSNLVGIYDGFSAPNVPTNSYFQNQHLTNENQSFQSVFDPSNLPTQSYFSDPTVTTEQKVQDNIAGEVSQDSAPYAVGKTADVSSEAKDKEDAANQTVNQPDPTNHNTLFRMSAAVGFNRQEMNELQNKIESVTLKDPVEFKQDSASFFDDFSKSNVSFNVEPAAKDDVENCESDFNICETCREVNQPGKEDSDFTSQLIENITSPIQLSNPVEVPFTDSSTIKDNESVFKSDHCQEISQITEDTIETIQSTTEYWDKKDIHKLDRTLNCEIDHPDVSSYGWCGSNDVEEPNAVHKDHDYNFHIDPNTIGFSSNTSLFFDNIPNNASDEIKAEFKSTKDDSPTDFVNRELSVPSAPLAEDIDETGGLDVQLIEQDAKAGFDFEEFVIEPSETDDDKIEVKERERTSEDPIADIDSFTNRIEKFKVLGESVESESNHKQHIEVPTSQSPAITIASYFDTGNYAAETHYRNSLTSPTSLNVFNLPTITSNISAFTPFQPELKEPLPPIEAPSLFTAAPFAEIKAPAYVPDTSTQTPVTTTITITSTIKHIIAEEIAIGAVLPDVDLDALIPSGDAESKVKLPGFSSVFHNPVVAANIPTTVFTTAITRPVVTEKQAVSNPTRSVYANPQSTLPDPKNFFATPAPAKEVTQDSDTSFNRLASYFATPATQDHTKSFFELSQGQDHLRKEANPQPNWESTQSYKSFFETNESEDAKNSKHKTLSELSQDSQQSKEQYMANVKLMEDLTTTKYYQPTPDQVVKTVNYFVVKLDNPRLSSTHLSQFKEDKIEEVLDSKSCCNNDVSFNFTDDNKVDVSKQILKCRQCMDGQSSEGAPKMDEQASDAASVQDNVTVNVLMDEKDQENVCIAHDNRNQAEYSPVKHHWFYRVDLEEKSTWKGFSEADSRNLELAHLSPDLSDSTVVATDGGRYDVNVKGRLRMPVYWSDKPTNVRRCSWFYKGTTDARYVPYTEATAEKLETEYQHGITTGTWHRRLVLPRNEAVVMHAPGVMVHFVQSSDGWSGGGGGGGANFLFRKKTVYRNPKINVAKDQVERIDHLVMVVHGIGEYRKQKFKLQSTTRPRVVRRGCDESEIEEPEPGRMDHLLLLCHGVGSACDMRFRSVEEVVDDFRATSLQLIQGHYKNSYDNGTVGRIEVLPISWHATLHSGELGVDKRLSQISLQSIPLLRGFTNDTVLDVLFYTSPAFCQTIVETVCAEINRIYALFKSRNPGFDGGVSLGGHSLGSVILYDLLCNQTDGSSPPKTYMNHSASAGLTNVKYPKLDFHPACLYGLGSPIAMFECIRGVELLGEDFKLPTCDHFFNIFHPYDPIAYRIEPLINPQLKDAPPFLIPHHKGRKRMHLELKETVARVGADLKQRLVESIKSTWSSMWRSQPPTRQQLEQVVEEELEKETLKETEKEEEPQHSPVDALKLVGKLNGGRRIDYVLQEAPFEMINEYLFAMSSHVCYWESEDTMLLILREIYESLGIQPDSTVPAQNLTVQRTRLATDEEATTLIDQPSSSN